jgi:micrococcal nuclease
MKRLFLTALLIAASGAFQLSAFEPGAASEQKAEACVPVVTEVLTGECVNVTDGDTIRVRTVDGLIVVRLEGIDAPEARQDHSSKATKALRDLVHRKVVEVHVTGTDRYDRTLAIVKIGEVSMNERLLVDGWCWQFDQYNCDPAWTKLEETARAAKRGLWEHENLVPPWEFRKLERERREVARQRQGGTQKPEPEPTETAPTDEDDKPLSYWLNTSGNVRHNSSCRYFKNTKRGRACSKSEGKACGICGG